MMRIRKGALNLGPSKKPADQRRLRKLVAAHSAGFVDAFATPDGRVAFRSVPKRVQKLRAKRKAQRRACRITRMHA